MKTLKYRLKGKTLYRRPPKIHTRGGGKVHGKSGQVVNINLHGGEFILPRGVKPTKGQINQVKRRHYKVR